tara:strand:- start:1794 stop:2177 length:384 start_codon:yes stop_codon:yes gene_type:complete
MDDIKIGSNKSFGIVFFVVFLIIAFYPIVNDGTLRVWALIISLVFIGLGLLNSRILTPLNKIWFKFGIFLGKIVSPTVMGLIFFLVLTPTGMFMRIIKKNFLNLKFDDSKSYWIKKDELKSKMKNQF